MTVDRNANLRPQSDCRSPNRCSATNPQTGWPRQPNTGEFNNVRQFDALRGAQCFAIEGWSCDEQPKNRNLEGGVNAATRCMPSGENSGEFMSTLA